MKVAFFLSALFSAQVLAIPEPDNTVVKDGEYTYTGIDKVWASQNQSYYSGVNTFYRGFYPSAVLKSAAIASQNAAGQPPTAVQANVNVLGTMAAGHAVVVVCSASQDLAQESAGRSRYGFPIRNVKARARFSFLDDVQCNRSHHPYPVTLGQSLQRPKSLRQIFPYSPAKLKCFHDPAP